MFDVMIVYKLNKIGDFNVTMINAAKHDKYDDFVLMLTKDELSEEIREEVEKFLDKMVKENNIKSESVDENGVRWLNIELTDEIWDKIKSEQNSAFVQALKEEQHVNAGFVFDELMSRGYKRPEMSTPIVSMVGESENMAFEKKVSFGWYNGKEEVVASFFVDGSISVETYNYDTEDENTTSGNKETILLFLSNNLLNSFH